MKLFLTSIAIMLALCEAEADTELRKRPHQSGGGREEGGKLGGRLEAMIEAQCSDPTTCAGVVVADLDCTFQNEPVPPDTTGMDVDTRAEARRVYRAQKKECKENMVKCACCANVSIEDILAARGDEGGTPARPGMGGGGGGIFGGEAGGGGRLQTMIETQCSDTSTCSGVDSTSLDCTFEPLMRPDMSNLDEDAQEDYKAQMEERRQDMVKCACCTTMSVEDIMAAARPLGGSDGRPGGMGRLPGDVSGLAGSTSSGDGGMSSGDGSTSSGDVGLSAGPVVRPFGGGGSGGRPGGMSGFRPQGGSVEGIDVQATLEEKCNEDGVDEKCSEIASQAQAMDCTKFDSMMSNLDSTLDMNTRGGRRKIFFYCGCCRGSGGD